MEKIYAIFEDKKLIRMSRDKDELVRYRNSFPEEERRKMLIAEKTEERESKMIGWNFDWTE